MTDNISKASDLEIALFLARHVDNPCSPQVWDRAYDIRDFYLREASRILPELKDTLAREIILRKIEKYQPKA